MIEPKLDDRARRLIGCGFLAPLVALVAFLVAATGDVEYDHVADTLSKLTARGIEGSWVWTAGLILYSLLMALFSAGLRRRFRAVGTARFLWGALLAHAVLMVGVAVFRDDLEPGGFFSLEGAVHDVVSGMAFSALVIAMVVMLGMTGEIGVLAPLRSLTVVVGGTMTALGIGFLFTPVAVQGVLQRVFVVLAATWILALATQSGRRV